MVEIPQKDEELHYRNVELHRTGKKLLGTVHLTKHHLCFSYYPDGQRKGISGNAVKSASSRAQSAQHRFTASATSSSLTEASVSSLANSEAPALSDVTTADAPNATRIAADGECGETPLKVERHRPRPKEIWIPYPLINYCVLRPSHTSGRAAQGHDIDSHVERPPEEDGLFPPVFGTATNERPSTDSARLGSVSSPVRAPSPSPQETGVSTATESGRPAAIRIRLKDFRMMALHFHSAQSGSFTDEAARQAFLALRSRCCVEKIENLHAFHYTLPREEKTATGLEYDARREYARMGIGGKAIDGPGTAWRVTDINSDYSYSATYPRVLCVPRTVSDNMLKYGGVFRSRSRIPCLSYLHSNGGSITRSSQPMVGVQNRRNPQDERLVSAIFSSHTPPLHLEDEHTQHLPNLTSPSSTTLGSSISDPDTLEQETVGLPISQSDTALNENITDKTTPPRKKVYGSTRRNLIVDARPKINALANRATGGGIEDIANYTNHGDTPVEKVFLNIANIHVMRSSLEKIVESFANSDYLDMKPNQELLRKSGWLGHIAGMLEGAEMVARVVGLGGSHVLVHCSDGWDRTAQISALAQVILDPHCRTLDGFITLVQKEFLSFGHKFRDRNGIEGSEKWFEIENERIAPSRNRDSMSNDQSSLNALGAKALTGARNWFEKNPGRLFRAQNTSRDNLTDGSTPRASSPGPNLVLHSPASSAGKEEKEHKMSEKEVSPIFHQFLDAVFQLQCQDSTAFEFNERFLRRLFYHVYSCQYGDFLFNTEKERSQYGGRVGSFWSHFAARRQEFVNPDYDAKVDDPLLLPRRQGAEREIEVRWWSALFGRKDEDMNTPRALAPADPMTTAPPSISFDDQTVNDSEKIDDIATPNGSVKESKSTPSFSTFRDSLSNGLSSLGIHTPEVQTESTVSSTAQPGDSGLEAIATDTTSADAPTASLNINPEKIAQAQPVAVEYEGDPLGVMASMSKKPASSSLDFAAFASQAAFSDR